MNTCNIESFRLILRNAASAEFSRIPAREQEIDFTFSQKFERKMEHLLKAERRQYWRLVNTAAKRAAVICAVFAAVLSLSFSVRAIREPVVQFFTEVYETFTQYFFAGDTVGTITHEYHITQLPEGFEQTDVFKNDVLISTIYENEIGDRLEFKQSVTDDTQFYMDNEQVQRQTVNLDGTDIDIWEDHNFKLLLWAKDGYWFNLTCYGNIETDLLLSMIASVA